MTFVKQKTNDMPEAAIGIKNLIKLSVLAGLFIFFVF